MEKVKVKVKEDAVKVYLKQFPPSFVPTKEQRRWLDKIREMEGKEYLAEREEEYGYFIPYEEPYIDEEGYNIVGISIPKELVELL